MIHTSAGATIMSGRSGDPATDARSGLPHVSNIELTGPVESITFEKEDDKKLEAVLLSRAVNTSKGTIVRSVHHAKLKMLFSPQFAPGTVLYIDPISLGLGNPNNPLSISNKLGIGGYFAIQGVSHTYNYAGARSTELDCKWQYFGDTDDSDTIEQFKPDLDITAEITVEDV